jgi:hypothetical protein
MLLIFSSPGKQPKTPMSRVAPQPTLFPRGFFEELAPENHLPLHVPRVLNISMLRAPEDGNIYGVVY